MVGPVCLRAHATRKAGSGNSRPSAFCRWRPLPYSLRTRLPHFSANSRRITTSDPHCASRRHGRRITRGFEAALQGSSRAPSRALAGRQTRRSRDVQPVRRRHALGRGCHAARRHCPIARQTRARATAPTRTADRPIVGAAHPAVQAVGGRAARGRGSGPADAEPGRTCVCAVVKCSPHRRLLIQISAPRRSVALRCPQASARLPVRSRGRGSRR